MKRLIRKILREEIEKSDKHYRILDKISNYVEIPYFKSMEGLTIYDKDDQEYIMRKILGNISITINPLSNNLIKDNKGNVIYKEEYDGYWTKSEYDDNNNWVYEEDKGDGWQKFEYNDNGDMLYWSTSHDEWRKWEYDDKGNLIYFEDNNGDWEKYEYDDNGNTLYYEYSNGDWGRLEYDDDGNEIYYESSEGYINDNR
jgi:hypothetical protein